MSDTSALIDRINASVRKKDYKPVSDEYTMSQLRRMLASSNLLRKNAEENMAKLLPLAIEMAMWKMVVASDPTLATQWDQLQVMVKLMEPDFFSICDRMVSQQRMDILEKFFFKEDRE